MGDFNSFEAEQAAVGANGKVRLLAVTAMLSAVAVVLQYLEFPIPMLMPGFIKMDLSDLPALIGSFAMGPMCGIMVCLIKNLIHLFASQSAFVGEFCNFLLGVAFVLPAGLIYAKNKTRKNAVIGAVVGCVVMALASFPINLFVVYPMYSAFMPMEAIVGAYQAILPAVKSLWQCLLIFNVPFTFAKAAICTLVTLLVYKKLSPILHGRR